MCFPDAAKLFEQSYRPVLYVGGGAARSDAGKLVQELAEVTNASDRHHAARTRCCA